MSASRSKPSQAIQKSIQDFAVLPLTLPAIPSIKSSAPTKHYLYIKPHVPKHPTPTADRALFLANVPIDASEGNIRALFADQLGGSRVARVAFDASVPAAPAHKRWMDRADADASEQDAKALAMLQPAKKGKKRKRSDVVAEGVVEDDQSALPKTWGSELRRSGSTAVVEFVDKPSMKGAWKEVQRVVKEEREVRWKGGEGLGVQRYKLHHTLTYPSRQALQSSINAYLTQFNQAELVRNKLHAKQRSVPDEDGFITVLRGGRAGPARLEEAERKQAELEERRKKKGAGGDFYRFQSREKRKEAEGELRRKFEQDRRRVEEMRQRRGKVQLE